MWYVFKKLSRKKVDNLFFKKKVATALIVGKIYNELTFNRCKFWLVADLHRLNVSCFRLFGCYLIHFSVTALAIKYYCFIVMLTKKLITELKY